MSFGTTARCIYIIANFKFMSRVTRLDCTEAVEALNVLYDALTPYLMHFVAVRRTTGKEKIQSKYRRTYAV